MNRPLRMRPIAGGRSRRGGTTLTEVLMALLVMGLGLVSVATLFPLSLLRSVEATKITNATLARINAEARLNASVWRDGSGNTIQRAILADPDKDGIPIRLGSFPSKFVFDPLGAWTFADDGVAPAIGSIVYAPAPFPSGWPNMTTFGDFDGNGAIEGDPNGNLLIEPGFDRNGDGTADTPYPVVPRFTFGLDRDQAKAFVTLPDTFITLADVLAGAVTVSPASAPTTVTFTNGQVFDEYRGTSVRITFIDPLGVRSEVRNYTLPGTGTNLTSLGLSPPLPAGFEVGRVTVEVPERRYTWLATVRRVGTKPSVSIAVFFRRSFDPADEKVYSVSEPAGSYNEFELPAKVDPASPTGALLRPPGMRTGGYMFDLHAFRWLKIASIEDVKASSGNHLRFTIDPEEADTPEPRVGVPVMFPSNVVEAYTLKK